MSFRLPEKFLASLTIFAGAMLVGWQANAAESPTPSGNVEIVRVWTAYRDARSFIRLSEYFSNKEDTGDAIVLRSQSSERTGFYFTVRLATSDKSALSAGRVVLHVITPTAEKARDFGFPLPTVSKRTERLEIGLTGADWTYGDVLPLAWKIEIFAADGSLLAQKQSFLWEKPSSPPRRAAAAK